MFDLSWGELVVIGIVALIAIGPKELPTVLRTIGQWMGKIRRMANEFQGQFQEALREAELADLQKHAEDLSSSVTDIAEHRSAGRGAEADRAHRRGRRRICRRATSGAEPPRRLNAAPAAEAAVPLPELPPPASEKDFAAGRAAAAAKRRRRSRSRSRPGAAHEPRGHRGDQGAADGASDRAALAADQGAASLSR